MQLPYGLWNGHIDPDLVANRARVSDLKWNDDGSGLVFSAKSTLFRKYNGKPWKLYRPDRAFTAVWAMAAEIWMYMEI